MLNGAAHVSTRLATASASARTYAPRITHRRATSPGRSRGKYFIECSQNATPSVAQIASDRSDEMTYHVGSVRRGRVSIAIVKPAPIHPSPR